MKRCLKNLLSFLLIISIIISSSLICANAHSGRTDSKGGHYDRSTGEYHYHNGSNSYRNKSEENKITENEVVTTISNEDENNIVLDFCISNIPLIATVLFFIILFIASLIFKKR